MSENIARYNVVLELLAEVKNSKKQIGEISGSVKGLQAAFSLAKKAFAGIFLSAAINKATKAVFNVTKNYEKYNTQLDIALGSQIRSDDAMRLIEETAKDTIFSVDELTASYVRFANRGIKLTKEELTSLADLAASQGKSFTSLTSAVLDAQSGQFTALKEFGIQARKEGDKVTFAFKGITKTVRATPNAINEAIASFGKLTGVAGANAKQMKTLSNILVSIKDNFEGILKNIGERFKETFRGALGVVSKFVDKIREFTEIPLSEKLREEQTELNVLVQSITDANVSQERRNELIAELQREYPGFLGNLDAEKVSNEDLVKRLNAVNDSYAKRIALQIVLEDKEDALRKSGEAIRKQLKEQRDVEAEFNEIVRDQSGRLRANRTTQEAIELAREETGVTKERGDQLRRYASLLGSGLFAFISEDEKRFLQLGNLLGGVAKVTSAELEYAEALRIVNELSEEAIYIEEQFRDELLLNAKVRGEGDELGDNTPLNPDIKKIQKAIGAYEQLRRKIAAITTEVKDLVAEGTPEALETVTIKKLALDIATEELEKVDAEIKELLLKEEFSPLRIEGKLAPIVDLPDFIKQLDEDIQKDLDNYEIKISSDRFTIFDDIGKALKEGLDPGEASKRLSDELKNLRVEQLNGIAALAIGTDEYKAAKEELLQITIAQGIVDKENDEAKAQRLKELQQLETSIYIDTAFQALDTINQITSAEIASVNKRINAQELRVADALAIAEKGNVAQLKLEEERLDELVLKRETALKRQAVIEKIAAQARIIQNTALTISNLQLAVASTGATFSIFSLPAAVAILAGVLASVSNLFTPPAFIEGTEMVGADPRYRGNKTHTGRDGYVGMFDGREKIVDPQTNKALGNFPNEKLPDAVSAYHYLTSKSNTLNKENAINNQKQLKESLAIYNYFSNKKISENKSMYTMMPQVNLSSESIIDLSGVQSEIRDMKEAFENLRFETKLDADGFSQRIYRLVQKRLEIKKYIA